MKRPFSIQHQQYRRVGKGEERAAPTVRDQESEIRSTGGHGATRLCPPYALWARHAVPLRKRAVHEPPLQLNSVRAELVEALFFPLSHLWERVPRRGGRGLVCGADTLGFAALTANLQNLWARTRYPLPALRSTLSRKRERVIILAGFDKLSPNGWKKLNAPVSCPETVAPVRCAAF